MIREIFTNVGMFGSFKDLVKHMEIEKIDRVEIKHIQTWNFSYFDKLVGIFSFDELKRVVT